MKKLMIAFAAVAMAVAANATTAYWGMDATTYDHTECADAKDLTGYTAYLVWGNNWDSTDVVGSISKAAITMAVADLTTAYYMPDYDYVSYAQPNGMGTLAEGTFGDVSGTRSENVKDFYLVLTDGKTDYAAYATTAEVFDGNMRADEVLASANVISFNGNTYMSKGDFSAIAVPEPTSALLLLLGVAGLALKRRRA